MDNIEIDFVSYIIGYFPIFSVQTKTKTKISSADFQGSAIFPNEKN